MANHSPKVRVPVHPGEMLREEFAKPHGLTQVVLAERLGISRRRVNEILRERRSITADTALRLSRLFGTTAQFWLNLQSHYDLLMAQRETDLRAVRPLRQRAAR